MLSGTVIKTQKQTNKTGATSQTLRGSVQMLKSMTIRPVRKRLITMGCLEGLTGRSTFSLKKHGSTAYSIPSYWKLESCSHWFKYEPLCIPKCSRAKCEAICPTQSLAIICLFLIKKKKCNSCKKVSHFTSISSCSVLFSGLWKIINYWFILAWNQLKILQILLYCKNYQVCGSFHSAL